MDFKGLLKNVPYPLMSHRVTKLLSLAPILPAFARRLKNDQYLLQSWPYVSGTQSQIYLTLTRLNLKDCSPPPPTPSWSILVGNRRSKI